MNRPNFIQLPETDSRSASALSRNGLTSPRIQHFDGDVPPTLSPLDAIAARSRKLAKELEETRRAGERRMSRLPPQVVTESLTEHHNNRPPIFRALSEGTDTVPPLPSIPNHSDRPGFHPRVANPTNRPTSQHARMSVALRPTHDQEGRENDTPSQLTEDPRDYFGAPRVDSPPPLDGETSFSTPQGAITALNSQDDHSRPIHTHSQPDLTLNLAPPQSHFHRLRPYQDASDDDYTSSNAGSTFSQSRKLSSSSGVSVPHSPISPYLQTHSRNLSGNSIGSPTRSSIARNFSRPMSSASMTNLRGEKSPGKAPLAMRASHLRQTSSFDGGNVPAGFMAGQASSYTHMTYSLPRGRLVSGRDSRLLAGLDAPSHEWQHPVPPGTSPYEGKASSELTVPSPMASARPSREEPQRSGFSFDLDTERGMTAEDRSPSTYYTPSGSVRSNDSGPAMLSAGAVPGTVLRPPPTPLSPVEEMSHSSRSNSTIRPSTSRSVSTQQSLPADEHVAKAIELHEKGDLKESTYHLRIAANKGHATGMLLYALACRHGWGMRANQKEGIQWLRKAVDCAMLEVADDENPKAHKPASDFNDKKTHRAQFALSIYELGVSHLNGWGIEMDKALALRCFEIAGHWGDPDALSEAGFCYAEGIGCKKDMKKAARFYRMAEAKGVSMIGNSWYV